MDYDFEKVLRIWIVIFVCAGIVAGVAGSLTCSWLYERVSVDVKGEE